MAHIPDRLFISILNAQNFMDKCNRASSVANEVGARRDAHEWVEKSHKELADWLLNNREANIEAFSEAREKGYRF